jgi:hypothetical protein
MGKPIPFRTTSGKRVREWRGRGGCCGWNLYINWVKIDLKKNIPGEEMDL